METSHKLSYRIFAHWATFCYRNAIWVILIALIAAALSIVYTSRNLGVYTDTTDMLSEDIPFRANHERYKAAFPQYKDTMLLVLDAPTPEQAHTAAKRLTAQLKNDDKHFHDVYYANGNSFFEKNGLLYKSISELGRITDRLAAAQPLVARIADDPTFYTFIGVLTEAIDALRTGRKLELEPVLNGVSVTMNARLSGAPRALSWEILFNGEAQQDTYQALILTQPKMDFTQLFAAEQPIIAAQTAARLIGITHNSPEQLRITGEVALSYDELNSAMRGAQSAGLISLAMVAIVLFFALRTAGSVLTVLLSLILGLLLTAAFATIAVGHLNLISIAFAVLYIGLGVDYAIHFLLRHQELQQSNIPTVNTLYTTGGDIGRALMICAITTAIGFYAFMPTDYRGVAELGLISGTGMLISLVVTLTLVPALQRYLPTFRKPTAKTTTSFDQLLASPPQWSHKYIYIVTGVILLASIIVLPDTRFDYNLLNMNDPHAESVETFQELLANAEDSPWHLIALAKDRQEIENITRRLNKLPEVDKTVTLFDLVPKDQEEKNFFIEEMALTLGPIALSKPSAEINNQALAQQRLALETLINALNQFAIEQPNHSVSTSARTLSASLSTLLTRLIVSEQEPNSHDAHLFHTIGNDLLHLLPDSLERMQTAFEAQPFTLQALPASLRAHWQNQNDTYRMIVYPKENINDNNALRNFVRAVQQIAPHATGAPVISLEAGEAVVDAFIQAFSLALLGVILALLILLRNVMDTLFVLAPLLLASLFTGACTVLFDIPFNFANIIALPLLLGIGIDCSVHMVHRNRNSETTHKSLLHTSTARAIFYSALTTLAGFGSLAFSPHQGTATMGLLLATGVLLTLVCVLFILPVLLQSSTRSKNSQSSN